MKNYCKHEPFGIYGSCDECAAMKKPMPRGEKHHRSKLTEAQVRTIRRLYATTNLDQYELAEMSGVNQSTINSIILNKTWKHVKEECGFEGGW